MTKITSPGTGAPLAGLHDHAADLEACLDLVNTLQLGDPVPLERLATPDDAVAWFADHHLVHAERIADQARSDGPAWLARVTGTRDAIRATWDAIVDGRAPDPAALTVLNAALASEPHLELRAVGGQIEIGHRHNVADPTGEALGALVRPLVDAIANGTTGRFRVCASDTCRWVFEDTSRSGRRRWCDMTTCGNRAKVRRYRSRRRDGADGADQVDDGAAAPPDA